MFASVRSCLSTRRVLTVLLQQVIKRSHEVLRFLAVRDSFDSRLLNLVWRASLDKHESVKHEIYIVLVELSQHLRLPLLDTLYEHIRSVPHAEYTQQTIILLRGFSVSALQSVYNTAPRRWYGLEELWLLMQTTSGVSTDLRGHAADILSEMLAWQQCATQRTHALTTRAAAPGDVGRRWTMHALCFPASAQCDCCCAHRPPILAPLCRAVAYWRVGAAGIASLQADIDSFPGQVTKEVGLFRFRARMAQLPARPS